MNLEGLGIWKRLMGRIPDYNKDGSGKTVAVVTPDKALTLTASNTMAPGETTWAKVMGKPSTFPTTWAQIADRPALFSGAYADLSGLPVLFSGDYGDLNGTPNFSPVATSGEYSDLKGRPALFSGAYDDLTGLPALFDGKWDSLTGKPATFATTWAQVAGKPSLFSGSYNDLTSKPVLFSGAYADLSGKPALFDGSWNSLADRPSTFPTTWGQVSGKPTFFSGSYNDLTDKPSIVTPAALTTALAAKADSTSVKRIDTYIGKTDANGLFTVAYPTPFAAVPSLQPEPPTLPSQVWVKVSSTTTGFSLRLTQRNTVNLLNIEVLLGATVNVPNADARVVVIAA